MYLQSSQVELSNLYLGVPTKAPLTLINGTLLPTEFHWGKVRAPGPQPAAPGTQLERGVVPQGASQNRCPTPPTAWLLSHRALKAGLPEGATPLIWFSLVLLSESPDSPAKKEAVRTARLPPRVACDRSTQLLGAQLGHCHWG